MVENVGNIQVDSKLQRAASQLAVAAEEAWLSVQLWLLG